MNLNDVQICDNVSMNAEYSHRPILDTLNAELLSQDIIPENNLHCPLDEDHELYGPLTSKSQVSR